MSHEMDDLARALAGKVSRRQALKRTMAAAGGAVVAFLIPARRAEARSLRHRRFRERRDLSLGAPLACVEFCVAIYGQNTAEALTCIVESVECQGPCFQFGPESPACHDSDCPPKTVCVSSTGYRAPEGGGTPPPQFICHPV